MHRGQTYIIKDNNSSEELISLRGRTVSTSGYPSIQHSVSTLAYLYELSENCIRYFMKVSRQLRPLTQMSVHAITFLLILLPLFSISFSQSLQENMKNAYFTALEYKNASKPKAALPYFAQAYAFYNAMNDTIQAKFPWQVPFFINSNYGVCLIKCEEYQLSEGFLLNAITVYKNNNPPEKQSEILCTAYMYLIRAYNRQAKAAWVKYFASALGQCSDPFYKSNTLSIQSRLSLDASDYTEAGKYLKAYASLLHSLKNLDKRDTHLSLFYEARIDYMDAIQNKDGLLDAFHALDSLKSTWNVKAYPYSYIKVIHKLLVTAISYNLPWNEYLNASELFARNYEGNDTYTRLLIIQNRYLSLVAENKFAKAIAIIKHTLDKDNNGQIDIADWKAAALKENFIKIYEDRIDIEYQRLSQGVHRGSLDSLLLLFNKYLDLCNIYMKNRHQASSRLGYLNYSEKPFSQIKEILYQYYSMDSRQSALPLKSFWQYHERLRGYIYAYLVNHQHSINFSKLNQNQINRLSLLRDSIMHYQNKIKQSKKRYEAATYRFKLYNTIATIDSLLQNVSESKREYSVGRSTTLQDIMVYNKKHKLTTIQYSLSRHNLYIFTITEDTISLNVKHINKDTIAILLKKYKDMLKYQHYFALSKQELEQRLMDFQQLSYRLYGLFLAPVEDKLSSTRLRIIPDPLMTGIPFETFCLSQAENPSFTALDYAIYHYTFHYSTIKSRPIQPIPDVGLRRMLCIIPDYHENLKYNYLGSRIGEYTFLKEHTDADIWTHSKAQPEYILHHWEDYSIINFSGHASAEVDNLTSSYLLANSDSAGNSMIFMEDIQYNQLNAQLVILNACSTQDGEQHFTEGLLGLQRAFFLAGAESIISTMWPISDRESAAIITDTYRNLASGYPTDKALRKAKLTFLSQNTPVYSAPFYWAAQNLNGSIVNGDKLIEPQSDNFIYIIGGIIVLLLVFFRYYRKKRTNIISGTE